MKKLLAIILILALLLPAAAMAAMDPIVGVWYIMLDYGEYPDPSTEGKDIMFYVLLFDSKNVISAVTYERNKDGTMAAQAANMGTWSKNDDGTYTTNMIGAGTLKAVMNGDRLEVQMLEKIWYSMQRMNFGSWYTDILSR